MSLFCLCVNNISQGCGAGLLLRQLLKAESGIGSTRDTQAELIERQLMDGLNN